MNYWIKFLKAVSFSSEWGLLFWSAVSSLLFVVLVIFLAFFQNLSGSTLPFTHINGLSLQAPSSTPSLGAEGYITTGESILTVYIQHDGCGQSEYWEYQVPSSDVSCNKTSCQAKINGIWRIIQLEK